MERDYKEVIQQLTIQHPDHEFRLINLPEANDVTELVLVATPKDQKIPVAMTAVEMLSNEEICQVMNHALQDDLMVKQFKQVLLSTTPEDIYATAQIQLLNKEKNQRYLKSRPCFQVNEDLIAAYYYRTNNENVSVTSGIASMYELDPDILKARALENMTRTYNLAYMNTASREIFRTGKKEVVDQRETILNDIANNNIKDMILVTNRGGEYGAANLLILDQIFGSLTTDLLVVPMSIHMIGILPANINVSPQMLQETISKANRQFPDDCLSDNIYLYSPTKKQTRIYVDKYGLVPECPNVMIQHEKRTPRHDH